MLERPKIFIDDPDLRYPHRYTYARHALGLIAVLLGGLSVVGWAFPFPTHEERFAWRFLSLYLPISAILIRQLAMEWDTKQKVWVHPYLPRVANVAMLFLYIVARSYIIVEVFTGLRGSPATLYETVDWSNYLPHFRDRDMLVLVFATFLSVTTCPLALFNIFMEVEVLDHAPTRSLIPCKLTIDLS